MARKLSDRLDGGSQRRAWVRGDAGPAPGKKFNSRSPVQITAESPQSTSRQAEGGNKSPVECAQGQDPWVRSVSWNDPESLFVLAFSAGKKSSPASI